MAEATSIALANLLIDLENPRLPQPNTGQREALRAIARQQDRRLLTLAKDILQNGLNPSELSIVMPFQEDGTRYVVIEGNRRIAALKALENPDVLSDAVKPAVLTAFRQLSKQYQNASIDAVPCVVVKDKDEARHWVELRHTSGNEGAGVIKWTSDDASRFRARNRIAEVHTQALDFLQDRGALTLDVRRKVPATSFKRLIGTPEVREKLGIEVVDGTLCLRASKSKVTKALMYVVDDLASGKTKVSDIYHKPQRLQYAKKLPAAVAVTPTLPIGQGVPVGAKVPSAQARRAAAARLGRPRDKLIPAACVLNVTDARIHAIESELRGLSLDKYPNAVSVLLRVFIELSADAYIDRMKLPEKKKLHEKLRDVTGDLLAHGKINQQQAKPVYRACAKDSWLAPSLDMMHNYIHNQHVFPAAGDLRAHWDSLQPFVIAMWSP